MKLSATASDQVVSVLQWQNQEAQEMVLPRWGWAGGG